ncbi:hypothetical protein ACWCHM_24635 [Micromonospora sp. SCSIO 07396]
MVDIEPVDKPSSLPTPAEVEAKTRSAAAKVALGKRYAAFISYRVDEHDRPIAHAIERGLQRLAKPWNKLRALEIFRDMSSLDANPLLWPRLCAVMDNCDWLIYLASPGSAESRWVGMELERWLRTKGPERIMIVVTGGEWRWDNALDDLDVTAAGNAAHPVLRGKFSSEPRFIDMRWIEKLPDLTPQTLTTQAQFREQLLELAAPLHGRPKEDLDSEAVRQERKTRRLRNAAVIALAVLTVFLTIAATLAVLNAREARLNEREARKQRAVAEQRARIATSLRLAALSRTNQGTDGSLRYLLAAQAYHLSPTTAATGALFELTQTGEVLGGPQEKDVQARIVGHRRGVTAAAFNSSADRVATLDGSGTLRLTALPGTAPVPVAVPSATGVAFADDTTIVVSTQSGLRAVDATTGTALPGAYPHGGRTVAVAAAGPGTVLSLDAEGRLALVAARGVQQQGRVATGGGTVRVASAAPVAIVQSGGRATVVDTRTLSATGSWALAGRQVTAISPDGTRLILVPPTRQDSDGQPNLEIAEVVETASGRSLWRATTFEYYVPRGAAFLPGGTDIVAATSGGVDGAPGQLFTRSQGSPGDNVGTPLLAPTTIAGLWSAPDGAKLLVATESGEAEVLFAGAQDLKPVYPLSAAVEGERLLVHTSDGLGIADAKGGGLRTVTSGEGGVLTPDGRTVVTWDGRIVDVATGKVRHRSLPPIAAKVRPVFARAGALMFYASKGSRSGNLVMVTLDTGRFVTVPSPLTLRGGGADQLFDGVLATNPDGTVLALRTFNDFNRKGPGAVATLATGDSLTLLARIGQATDESGALGFTPDGSKLILYSKQIATLLDPATLRADGETFYGNAQGRWYPAPDRRTFVASSCPTGIIDSATFQVVATIPGTESVENGCADLPDIAWTDSGRLLLVGVPDGTFARYTVEPAQLLDRACRLAGRNLSASEWRQYLPEWPYQQTCPGSDPSSGPATTGSTGPASPAPSVTPGPAGTSPSPRGAQGGDTPTSADAVESDTPR